MNISAGRSRPGTGKDRAEDGPEVRRKRRAGGRIRQHEIKTFTGLKIADIISRTSSLLLVLFAYSPDVRDVRNPGGGESTLAEGERLRGNEG